MFGPAGHLYVYFTYGMHWCANVVCNPAGAGRGRADAGAGPRRGAGGHVGLAGKARRERELCSGPGRLAALGLTGGFYGTDLAAGRVLLLDDGTRRRTSRGTGSGSG